MASYADCFRLRLHSQLICYQKYARISFYAFHSNLRRMNERLPDSTYDTLHHFISESSWDRQAVMDEVVHRVQATLDEVASEQGMLLDECGWEKAGTKRVGWLGSTSARWAKSVTGRWSACLSCSAGIPRRA